MIGRRAFLSGSALLGPALLAQSAAAQSVTPTAAPAAAPARPRFSYVETRGAPSPAMPLETRAFAAHAVKVQFADLDEATRKKAKRRILDLFGCALGGVHASGNAALVRMLQAQRGPQEASVIGYRAKLPAAEAAMANAIISRSYDYEVMTVVVGDRLIGSHNSPTTCFTALALAERARLSGADFLTALVVGDDIAARMLAASGLDLGMGWDASSVFTAIAAAAIGARLVGASEEQAQDALGLAVDMVCGTTQSVWDGAPGWKFVGGASARNGIFAAQLAKTGEWPGIRDALRAPYALYGQFTPGLVDPPALIADLGAKFYGEEYFKPYPSCAATHMMHECAFQLRETHHPAPEDIRSVEVRIPGFVLSTALAQAFEPGRDPHTVANFNIRYQSATGLLRGPIRLEHYAPEAINAPDIAALIAKLKLAALRQGETGIVIDVAMRDGRMLTQRHSGTPMRNPAIRASTDAEILEKFMGQAAFSNVVTPQSARQIAERIDSIERERDIRSLVSLMRGRA